MGKNWVKINAMVDLYKENVTLQVVADKFGMTRQGARSALAGAGVDTSRKLKPKPLPKLPSYEERFWRRIDKDQPPHPVLRTPCWLWAVGSQMPFGYGRMHYKGSGHYSHHLAWFFTHGYFSKQWVLHRCGNAACCNPEHLYEGTAKDNARDRFEHARNRLSAANTSC